MFLKLIRLLVMFVFVPFLILTMFLLLFAPIMAFADIKAVIEHNAPKSNVYFILLFFISLTIYLSARIHLFRTIYVKIPVLWPLSQMLYITTIGLAFGLFFMNLWADNETISKPMAIVLTIISLLVVRLFMSYWYKKYPVSVKMFK